MGCRAGVLWKGFWEIRPVVMRSSLGWVGGNGLSWRGLTRGKIFCDSLPRCEILLSTGDRRRAQRRFSPVIHEELSPNGSSAGSDVKLRMSLSFGHRFVARCSLNTGLWPHFEDGPPPNSATTKSSSRRDGSSEDLESPPALVIGQQLQKFSHFRDGNVQWRRYLEVKQDTRDRNHVISLGNERSLANSGGANGVDAASDVTVICFDIETTGFSVSNDKIIEFAARDLAGGVYSTIETLVNPQREVMNQHIHNISSHMVNNPNVPRWKDVALAILDFVESRRRGRGEVILVAHNGKRFDVPFIIKEFRSCGLSIPSHWRFADSMTLARLAMKNSGISPPKTSLGTLFSHYNLQSVGQAHRAMADVNMLAQVLQMLMIDLEMSTTELLAQSFFAADVVKPKSSTASIKRVMNGLKGGDVARLGRKRIVVDRVPNGTPHAPWDG